MSFQSTRKNMGLNWNHMAAHLREICWRGGREGERGSPGGQSRGCREGSGRPEGPWAGARRWPGGTGVAQGQGTSWEASFSPSPCGIPHGACRRGPRVPAPCAVLGTVPGSAGRVLEGGGVAAGLLPLGGPRPATQPLLVTPPGGRALGWLLSPDPKGRWVPGGWRGRAVTLWPLPQPPLGWLAAPQHSWYW